MLPNVFSAQLKVKDQICSKNRSMLTLNLGLNKIKFIKKVFRRLACVDRANYEPATEVYRLTIFQGQHST